MIGRAAGFVLAAAIVALALVACGSPPGGVEANDAAVADADIVDAGAPDATLIELGPALAFDEVGLIGGNAVFGLLGSQLLNQQLADQIASGQFLLVIELRDLDDPSGQSDDDIDVGFYNATDTDDDPTDNFVSFDPEKMLANPSSLGPDGVPSLLFDDASITDGSLVARGVFNLPLGGIPIPLGDSVLKGTFVSGGGGTEVHIFRDGTLTGTVPISIMGIVPNIAGGMCGGATLLDIMVTGCGFGSFQPDVDVDGDGLETLFDTAGDGSVDRCVDGDGVTEFLGTDCWQNPAIADGYALVIGMHATRVILLLEL